jgi:hypothetical protein
MLSVVLVGVLAPSRGLRKEPDLPEVKDHADLRLVHEQPVLKDIRELVLTRTHVAHSH